MNSNRIETQSRIRAGTGRLTARRVCILAVVVLLNACASGREIDEDASSIVARADSKKLASSSVVRAVASAPEGIRPKPQIDMLWRAFQGTVPDGSGGTRFLDADEVVDRGPGHVVAGGSFVGIPVDMKRTRKLRDDIRRARAIAASRGVDIHFHVSIRPDHYVEQKGLPVVPGFRDEWLFRSSAADVRADRARFESRGWTIEPADFVSLDFLRRIELSDQATQPHFYGPVEPKRRRYRVNGVLTDLRNPGYRSWQLDWMEDFVAFTGADGVVVGLKTGWHAFPMNYPKASPDGRWGGPLSDTGFGAGEYEASVTAWVREANARGLSIYLQDSTPGSDGPESWYPPELIEAIAGRFNPVPLEKRGAVRRVIDQVRQRTN